MFTSEAGHLWVPQENVADFKDALKEWKMRGVAVGGRGDGQR